MVLLIGPPALRELLPILLSHSASTQTEDHQEVPLLRLEKNREEPDPELLESLKQQYPPPTETPLSSDLDGQDKTEPLG